MPLLYVLWTVSLLTIIAVATQSSGELSYKLARNMADIAQHDALAEAALNRAVLSLLDKRIRQRPAPVGPTQLVSFNGNEVRVRIADEQGRIDINHADALLLANLFRAANVPTAKARQIADAMLDWRDTDNLRRLNGAEEQDYRRAGLSYRPRNRPFPVVEEMKLVLGMTPQIFAKVEAGLTVYSGKSRVDVRIASPLVKQALRGGNAAPSAANSSLGPSPETEPITQSRSGNAYRIHVEFVWKSVPVIREAVIRFRSDRSDPYWLIRWQ